MGILSRIFSRTTAADPAPAAAPTGAKRPAVKTVTHKVAGTSYRQEALLAMGKLNPDFKLTKKELLKRWPEGVTVYEHTFSPARAELVPEPENPHDPKAIKVLVDGQHVGYIKAGSCAHIHRLLREGRILKIEPEIIGGRYKSLYSLDADPRSSADFELDKGEDSIGVRLTITEAPAAPGPL